MNYARESAIALPMICVNADANTFTALHIQQTRMIKMFILDEADEMLNQGFLEQIYDIYRHLPHDIQVVLLSATLPQEILELTKKFMTEPIRVLVKRDELTLEGIKQFFIAVEQEKWKFETLCDLYDSLTITQAVIFCNTKRKVEELAKQMRDANFTVAAMHGEMPQRERSAIMEEFRSGKCERLGGMRCGAVQCTAATLLRTRPALTRDAGDDCEAHLSGAAHFPTRYSMLTAVHISAFVLLPPLALPLPLSRSSRTHRWVPCANYDGCLGAWA